MLPHPSAVHLIGRTECCRLKAPGRMPLTDRCGSHLLPGGWAEASAPGEGRGVEPEARAGRGREQAGAGPARQPEMLSGRDGAQRRGALR